MIVAPGADGPGSGEAGAGKRRRSVLISAGAIALMAAVACGAIAGRLLSNRKPQYAQVIAVQPITRRVRMPREVCKSEEVKHLKPELDSGKPAGERGDRNAHADDTYTTTEQHCTSVYELEEQPQGYEVRYRLNGLEGSVHMDHVPGARIPLLDGQLVPDDSAAGTRTAGSN